MERMLTTFNILMTMRVNPTKTVTTAKRTPNLLALLERNVPQLPPSIRRMMMCKFPWLFFSLCCTYAGFHSLEITPLPTPSSVKPAGGKKRTIANCESDDSDVFIPRYDILSVCYIQDIDDFNALVLPATVPKRPVLKSLLLPRRFWSLLISLSLIRQCTYLF